MYTHNFTFALISENRILLLEKENYNGDLLNTGAFLIKVLTVHYHNDFILQSTV